MQYNEHEIDELARRYDGTTFPIDREDAKLLSEACSYLKAYKDIVNENSDGWCHWSAGSRVAQSLESIVWLATFPEHAYQNKREQPTRAKLDAAKRRIKSFCTRRGLPKPQETEHDAVCRAVAGPNLRGGCVCK